MNKTQEHTPILSVYVPNWNNGKYIEEMMDSVLAQTFTDWRIIFVDDQSTDNSPELIRKYAEKDSRIQLVVRDREPKGAQTCRNIGLSATEGSKYVICLDGDDVIASYCFQQRVEFMEKHPDIDFAIFPAKKFVTEPNDSTCNYYGISNDADALDGFLTCMLPYLVVTNIYRRDSLVNKGISWDENIKSLQDSDFNIQVLVSRLRYVYAEDAGVDYYWRVIAGSGSVTTKIVSKEHSSSHLYFLDKLYDTMSSELKRNHSYTIQQRLVIFADILRPHKDAFDKLMELQWFKRYPWLRLRILLYRHFAAKRRVRILFFPLLTIDRVRRQIKYMKLNSSASKRYSQTK